MKLFWCPKTRSVRAIWMLEEVGRPYRRELVDIRDPDAERSADFLAASPMGKVPALQDDSVHMAESAAICLYAADRYASGELAPAADDPARGRFLYWMFYTPAVIEPAMSEKFAGTKTNRFTSGWGDFETMIAAIERGLEPGPWILGDRFTAADVMVGSSVVFMRDFEMLPDVEALHAYADRCLERPAYQRALQIDQAA
ncbi:MAG TPA: glutathione S-transferase [Thermoanaerobaculia bacterium]|nr:glutathione S-transferase [Thermoanaerobaculia bacterium]